MTDIPNKRNTDTLAIPNGVLDKMQSGISGSIPRY
jgi:hypothetical protein